MKVREEEISSIKMNRAMWLLLLLFDLTQNAVLRDQLIYLQVALV